VVRFLPSASVPRGKPPALPAATAPRGAGGSAGAAPFRPPGAEGGCPGVRRLGFHTVALLPSVSSRSRPAEAKNYVFCPFDSTAQTRTRQINVFTKNKHAVRFGRYASCQLPQAVVCVAGAEIKPRRCGGLETQITALGRSHRRPKFPFFYSCSYLHVFALSTTVHLANPCSASVFSGFSCPHCHCSSPFCSFLLIQHPYKHHVNQEYINLPSVG